MLPEQEDYLRTQLFISDDGVEYNILELVKWAEENCDVQDISTDTLLHEFDGDEQRSVEPDGSPEFVRRAIDAEDFPIIVQRKRSGDCWVMDGRHRLWKRIFLDRRRTIRGYVIAESELPEGAIDGFGCLTTEEDDDGRPDD